MSEQAKGVCPAKIWVFIRIVGCVMINVVKAISSTIGGIDDE
ncbi:hypothetical protein B4113_2151 [Geobacillus sp. B4113_201601]|nr:hypothetical protein B4113_2151 [Geobacillus sp. B4113_201601]